ncbi:MAG: hypothetical protein HYV00_00545, partial [Deltaproteobacteria bacterium]|nr:hypothetical protein [Deltaproteobacteria bacterium]
ARRQGVKLESVFDETFVTAGRDSDYVLMANEGLRSHGIENYSVAMELDNMEAVKRTISLNLGIGFLPFLGVRKEIQTGEICKIRVKHTSLECTLVLVHRQGKFFTPAMAEMIKFCREALSS